MTIDSAAGNPKLDVIRFRPEIRGPESNLEAIVASHLSVIMKPNGARGWVGASASVGASRPDLIIAAYEPHISQLAGLERIHLDILSYLHNVKAARATTVARRLRRNQTKINRGLKELLDMGVLGQSAAAYQLPSESRGVLHEVISIEVKVRDWRRALQQAMLNRVLSNRSYIAVPAEIAKRLQAEALIDQAGIGLLSVDLSKGMQLLKPASAIRALIPAYYYRIASLIANNMPGWAQSDGL